MVQVSQSFNDVVTPRGHSIEIPRRYYSTCDCRCLGCRVMPPAAAWILAVSTLNLFRQCLWRTMLRSTSLYVSTHLRLVRFTHMTHALPSSHRSTRDRQVPLIQRRLRAP